jgi:hypothetical protein
VSDFLVLPTPDRAAITAAKIASTANTPSTTKKPPKLSLANSTAMVPCALTAITPLTANTTTLTSGNTRNAGRLSIPPAATRPFRWRMVLQPGHEHQMSALCDLLCRQLVQPLHFPRRT